MKGCAQWNPFMVEKDFRLQRVSKPAGTARIVLPTKKLSLVYLKTQFLMSLKIGGPWHTTLCYAPIQMAS